MNESDVQPEKAYLHYKGGAYWVVAVATNATNDSEGVRVVVYRSEKDGAVYVRALEEFLEPVLWPDGTTRPRFTPANIR